MKRLIISYCIILVNTSLFGQSFPDGMSYQAQVYSSTGGVLADVVVGIRFNIRAGSMSGTIVWQEDHTITLDNVGHFSTVVGMGVSTGAGSVLAFSDIVWSDNTYFLEMLVDEANDGSFVSTMTQQMMAVPFAYHTKTTSQKYSLSGLEDVDTAGVQVGDILKWNGTTWTPAKDSIASCDTVAYASSAGHTIYADTAMYADTCVIVGYVDSTGFSFFSIQAIMPFIVIPPYTLIPLLSHYMPFKTGI